MDYIIPIILVLVTLFGLIKKVNVFEAFVRGAKDGIYTLFRIAPTMIGLIVAVGVFKSSGALDLICTFLQPVTDFLGFPKQLVPMAMLRPVSGSGATAILTNVFKEYGADSFVGRCASVLSGSTETTFYAITMYYSSVGIKRIRHTMVAGLAADLTAMILSVVTVSLFLP